MLSVETHTQLREQTRVVVPDIARQITDSIMKHLPMELHEALVSRIATAIQNKMVSAAWTGLTTAPSASVVEVRARNEPPVVLWASEAGAYMGTCSWLTRPKALYNVWRRTHEVSLMAAAQVWKARGRKPRRWLSRDIVASMATHGHVEDKGVATSTTASERTRDEFVAIQTAAEVATFRDCHGASAPETLRLYASKGRAAEDETADLLAMLLKQQVSARNSASLWRSDVGTRPMDKGYQVRPMGPLVDPGVYTIVGKVDGWLTEPPYENVIVEFKCRMGDLPKDIPPQDMAQLQTYMEMHDTAFALYVQRSLGSSELVVQEVKRDPAAWATIKDALEKFVIDVRRLLRGSAEDEVLRHEVLLAGEK